MRGGTRAWSALIGAAVLLATPPAWAGNEPEGGLPSYTAPVALAEEEETPVREVPRSGQGMLVVGSLGLIGAAVVGAGTIALAADGYSSDLWQLTTLLAVSGGIGGSLIVWGGTVRRRKYRAWLAEQPDADTVPSQGTGLVGAGAFLLIAGAAGSTFGTVGWVIDNSFSFESDGVSPVWPTLFGLGVTGLTVGSTLTIVGMRRHRSFHAWRRTIPVELVPSVSPLVLRGADGSPRTGVQIGLAGRF